MEQAPVTRVCKKCSTEKKLSEFVPHSTCKYGRSHTCYKCVLPPKKVKSMICKKCGGDLIKVLIKKKNTYEYQCRPCINKSKRKNASLPHNKIKNSKWRKDYYEKNKERENEYSRKKQKELYLKNPEKFITKAREYYYNVSKHSKKRKENVRACGKKQRELLQPTYIKRCICNTFGIPFSKISDEQVQLQKESILLYREYKQLKQQLQ